MVTILSRGHCIVKLEGNSGIRFRVISCISVDLESNFNTIYKNIKSSIAKSYSRIKLFREVES